MKFKIKPGHGKHTDENGGVHRVGEIFSSDRELDVKFPGKFEKLGGRKGKDETPDDTPAEDIDALVNADPDEETEDEPVITLKAMNQGPKKWDVFKVVDGELTDEAVNDEFLTKAQAADVVKAGYEALEDED